LNIKKALTTKDRVAAQYVPVIVYIVVVGSVVAGHGTKKAAASTRHGNEQKPSAFARAIALSFAVFPKGQRIYARSFKKLPEPFLTWVDDLNKL
jgi:hypothetical protein